MIIFTKSCDECWNMLCCQVQNKSVTKTDKTDREKEEKRQTDRVTKSEVEF